MPPARCALFDPAFSAREAAALRALGLCLLTENEVRRAPGFAGHRGHGSAVTGSAVPAQEGKHGVDGAATLFYMVHCGKALYNNLLWSNWSPAALSKLVIIGNSFRGIEERSGHTLVKLWCLTLLYSSLSRYFIFIVSDSYFSISHIS